MNCSNVYVYNIDCAERFIAYWTRMYFFLFIRTMAGYMNEQFVLGRKGLWAFRAGKEQNFGTVLLSHVFQIGVMHFEGSVAKVAPYVCSVADDIAPG